mmetsp:Transcript_10846/g.25393  ORF Transcript_10846/g.25393 Transcript_10846/m.25393 type:complete len:333 (+) Transcript_10846:715-1713(+)
MLGVLPKHGRPLLALVRMESHGVVGCIDIIPRGPGADSNVDFFALEEHGGAAVVRDVDGEVAAREGEAGGPEGVKHGALGAEHGVDLEGGAVPQQSLGCELRLAHHRRRAPSASALGVEGALGVGGVGCEHGHVVLRRVELRDRVLVPPGHEGHVRVRLKHEVLPPVEAVADVPREGGSGSVLGALLVEPHVRPPAAERRKLVLGALRLRGGGGRARCQRGPSAHFFVLEAGHVALGVLLHNPDEDPLRVLCLVEGVGEGHVAQLVAVARHLEENRGQALNEASQVLTRSPCEAVGCRVVPWRQWIDSVNEDKPRPRLGVPDRPVRPPAAAR